MLTDHNPAQHQQFALEDWADFTEGDVHILNELRAWPLPIMMLLNRVAAKVPRATRRQRKAVKWAILKRLGTLIRRGRLCRFRRRFVCLPGYRLPNEVPARVIHMLSTRGGSTSKRKRQRKSSSTSFSTGSLSRPELQPPQKPKALQCPLTSARSAKPMPDSGEIHRAATALARLPRGAKKWSGWIDDKHRVWCGQRILLPGGTRAYAYGARRRQVVYFLDWPPVMDVDDLSRWGVLPAHEVRISHDPAAQLLGRLKAGVREKSSTIKAAAVRLNGCCPVRPGRRPRGRPRKVPPNLS